MSDYELAVVGLGGFGSAAAYWASKRMGGGVVGFEQFELGHRNGASEDRSRIIRYSYHRPDYVRLAAHAYHTWEVVGREAGEQLVVTTGGLDFFPLGGSIPLADYQGSLEAAGVDHEILSAGEGMRRWPQFVLPPGAVVLWQPDAGAVLADKANRAHRRLALAAGAVLEERTAVTLIEPLGGGSNGYQIEAGGRRLTVRCLIVTADAWTNRVLATLGLRLNLRVTREEVAYYRPTSQSYRSLPIWIWMDEPGFYGFPDLEGAGIKLGQDVGGPEVDPDRRTHQPDPDYQARLAEFLDRLLPGARGDLQEARTCLYTLTPDREFVIDRLPGHPSAAVALGAAHGFKFASVIGRSLVELVLDGEASVDITGFPILPVLA